jgi:hypothetical protein
MLKNMKEFTGNNFEDMIDIKTDRKCIRPGSEFGSFHTAIAGDIELVNKSITETDPCKVSRVSDLLFNSGHQSRSFYNNWKLNAVDLFYHKLYFNGVIKGWFYPP